MILGSQAGGGGGGCYCFKIIDLTIMHSQLTVFVNDKYLTCVLFVLFKSFSVCNQT